MTRQWKNNLPPDKRSLQSGGWKPTTKETKDDQAMKERVTSRKSRLPAGEWEPTTEGTRNDQVMKKQFTSRQRSLLLRKKDDQAE